MTMVRRPFFVPWGPASLALAVCVAACVGGPGDPTSGGQGSVDRRSSSRRSDEPGPASTEPRGASSETAGDLAPLAESTDAGTD